MASQLLQLYRTLERLQQPVLIKVPHTRAAVCARCARCSLCPLCLHKKHPVRNGESAKIGADSQPASALPCAQPALPFSACDRLRFRVPCRRRVAWDSLCSWPWCLQPCPACSPCLPTPFEAPQAHLTAQWLPPVRQQQPVDPVRCSAPITRPAGVTLPPASTSVALQAAFHATRCSVSSARLPAATTAAVAHVWTHPHHRSQLPAPPPPPRLLQHLPTVHTRAPLAP